MANEFKKGDGSCSTGDLMRSTRTARKILVELVVASAIFFPIKGFSENSQATTKTTIDGNGVAHVPAFEIPLSIYMSDFSKKVFIEKSLNSAASGYSPGIDIKRAREIYDKFTISPWLERAKAIYRTTVEEKKLGGVRVYIVTPTTNSAAQQVGKRVLINLHGGAFQVGAGLGQLAESIPIAGASKIKVISIDYRLGPEHKFPAASEDVAAVYRELIKTYEPKNIGIFGCSAGGILTAMSMAWFQKEQLPIPGAIGIFCAGADAAWGGESRYLAAPLTGQQPPPATPNPPRPGFPMDYLSDVDLHDPLVSPVVSPAVLKKFPPTLLITGTRADELSSTIYTHAQLVKVGVEARLHVWEGMWHGFIYDVDLPESQEAYDVIARFFNQHLGHNNAQVVSPATTES